MAIPERERFLRPESTLSQAQSLAQDFIITQLAAQKEPTLLLLEGLPGVGKSTVIDTIPPDSSAVQIVHDFPDLRDDSDISNHGAVVMGVTPSEAKKMRERYGGTHQIQTHIMQGMDVHETTILLTKMLKGKNHRLPIATLVERTMGIPRLGELLVMNPDISEELVNAVVNDYLTILHYSIGLNNCGSYLSIPPSQEMLDGYARSSKEGIDLPVILKRQSELTKRTGIQEPSPEFVDPATAAIYTTAWEQGRKGGDPRIVIFAPEIGEDTYASIEQSLGLSPTNPDWSWPAYEVIARSQRGQMFKVGGAKIKLLLRTPIGEEYNDYPHEAYDLQQWFTTNQLPMQPTEGLNKATLLLTCTDHAGSFIAPLTFGYMTESLLQQLGVPYLAKNSLAKALYWYNPPKKKISSFTLPER